MSDMEDISDAEVEELLQRRIRRQKVIRNRPNHFDIWDDTDFYNRFRMSKQSAFWVLHQIQSEIESKTTWNNALSSETMFLLTLRFYASGGMLITAGDFCGISKSTASLAVKKVSHHIALLRELFIHMPREECEKNTIKAKFFNVAKFPRVIGALDCTHIRIQSPGGGNAEVYRNRKGFFSLNVQTISDPDLNIMDIVARWPGSAHDSNIFSNSRICSRFEQGEFGDSLIVADSAYGNNKYLMTPLRTCQNAEENLYNESQIRTRNCVERCYGVWKKRFPILSTGLRLKMKTIESIIIATAVLHNICCSNNEPVPPDVDDYLEEQINLTNSVGNTVRYEMEGNNQTRKALIENYFKNLL